MLTSIPDELFDPLINLTDISNMFCTCLLIEHIPEKLFANCPHIRKVDYMLSDTSLCKIPDNLFEGLDELESAECAFYNTWLKKIPKGLFANKRKLTNLKKCFE